MTKDEKDLARGGTTGSPQSSRTASKLGGGWKADKAPRVPHRNRWDVKYFFAGGASLQWISHRDRSVPAAQMIAALRDMANVIEKSEQQFTTSSSVSAPAVPNPPDNPRPSQRVEESSSSSSEGQ